MKFYKCASCKIIIGVDIGDSVYCSKCGMPMFYDRYINERTLKKRKKLKEYDERM